MSLLVALLRFILSLFFFLPRSFFRLLVYILLTLYPEILPERVDVPSSTTRAPGQPDSSLARIPRSPQFDPNQLYESLVERMRRRLKPSLQGCEWLEQDTIEVDAFLALGDFAKVLSGTMGNRKVAIKAYRYSLPCPDDSPIYMVSGVYLRYVTSTESRQRFCAEALGCSRLKGPHIVPFIGVYSTPNHPMALVFELMDHQDLKVYLENLKGPESEPKLVRFHIHIRRSSYQRLEASCWV